MRRSIALAFVSLTVGLGSLFVTAPGCGGGSTPSVENLCGWLGDENNCYRRFAKGVNDIEKDATAPKCGMFTTDADLADKAYADDPNPDKSPTKRTAGVFTSREALDVCFITGQNAEGQSIGGKVLFDPPLDPNAFPAALFSYKIIDGIGVECGSGTFVAKNAFTVTIGTPEEVETGSSGTGTSTSSKTETSPITEGSFTISQGDEAQVVDTLCPNAEAHHFNLYQLDKCEQYADLLPRAEVTSNPGAAGTVQDGTVVGGALGSVRLRVFWPPTKDGSDSSDPLADQQLVGVEYFDCKFPPPLPPCADGVKGDGETDIDCGGLLCDPCLGYQTCISNGDCTSLDGKTGADCDCIPDNMGIRRCCGQAPM